MSVAQVLRRAGVQHPLTRTVRLDELRVGEAVVDAGTPIELDLLLEATGNAVVATGAVRTRARCECRRCLEPFDLPIDTVVREIFESRPVEGETYPLSAEHIDLVPFVRDAVLLALPLAPLCREDCPGPAPEAFPALADAGTDDGGDAGGRDAVGANSANSANGADEPGPNDAEPTAGDGPRDPRWAALDQLRLDR